MLQSETGCVWTNGLRDGRVAMVGEGWGRIGQGVWRDKSTGRKGAVDHGRPFIVQQAELAMTNPLGELRANEGYVAWI